MTRNVVDQVIAEDYAAYHADCVDVCASLPSNSVGLMVESCPFPGMYTYSNSPYDMGNVTSIEQMIGQYRFAQIESLRIMMPGRNQFVHITQAVAQKQRDGYIGLKDFRGKLIEMMQDVGWIYYGEIPVDKNPQVKAVRTKDQGLQFKSLVRDAAKMHTGMADYVLQFQKPGENLIPVTAGAANRKYPDANGWVTAEEWILWARPVWYAQDYDPRTGLPCMGRDGIKETDVLNVAQAKDTNDERHLCPLQLGLIDRLVKVWSNPDEVVVDKFMGIGSTGYVSIKNRRKFIGAELKSSYFRIAVKNLNRAISERSAMTLFDLMPEPQLQMELVA